MAASPIVSPFPLKTITEISLRALHYTKLGKANAQSHKPHILEELQNWNSRHYIIDLESKVMLFKKYINQAVLTLQVSSMAFNSVR